MQRNILALALGASIIGAAALAACSGGGGGSSAPMVSTPANVPGSSGTDSTLGSAQLTLTINRTQHAKRTQSTRRGARGTRKPAYVSTNAQGLQVAVTAGTVTKTIYADISPGSLLCTPTSGSVSTCTVTIPTLAANETITATELDQLPTAPVVNGYGTAGFPTGSNILAANTLSTTLTLGKVVSLTLGLGPVAAAVGWFDCTGSGPQAPAPSATTANFGFDGGGSSTAGRIVVTAGVASAGVIEPDFEDAAIGFFDSDTTPVPFVDVNGSHTPITITSSNSAVSFAPMVNNGTPPPAGAFTTTASIPDDGYEWFNCLFVVPVQVAANFVGTSATVSVNNNLTALNPHLSPPAGYGGPLVYNLAALTASAVSGSPAVTGPITGTVTGTDFMATAGMVAESATTAFSDMLCKSSGGATLATISTTAINTSTWQQVFTIHPATAGSCTFVLADNNTGIPTLPINVTVDP